MPFKSEAQRRYLHSQEPATAQRWEKKTVNNANLPERVGRKRKKKSSLLAAFEEGGRRLNSNR
jgi:hypothetical protein